MSEHLKNFEVQYFDDQASDDPGSYVFFDHFFTLFQSMVSVFKIVLLQI